MELITNISSKVESREEEINFIKMVEQETKRRVSKVKWDEFFDITTACYIDGRFVCVADYNLPKEYYEALKKA